MPMSFFGRCPQGTIWYLWCLQGTMYPPEIQVFDGKLGLNDACGFDSGSKHVLLTREVVRGCNAL